MGQLLAVHNEKLDKQDKLIKSCLKKIDRFHNDINRETEAIKKGCERDIRKIDERLRIMEKKMWTIFGGLTVISFLLSVTRTANPEAVDNFNTISSMMDSSGSIELSNFVDVHYVNLLSGRLDKFSRKERRSL